MSESLIVYVQLNAEALGTEIEQFEIDIAGFASWDDLTSGVNEQWSDYIFENEDELDKLGISTDDMEDDGYDVIDTDLPSGLDWLCRNGTGIDDVADWEWDWLEYFAGDSKEADVVYAAWSLDISPGNLDEAYMGEWGSDADFAQDYAEQIGAVDTEKSGSWPYGCIDWEWASRELMMDFSEYNEHYFRAL